jgi:hypothetical protein
MSGNQNKSALAGQAATLAEVKQATTRIRGVFEARYWERDAASDATSGCRPAAPSEAVTRLTGQIRHRVLAPPGLGLVTATVSAGVFFETHTHISLRDIQLKIDDPGRRGLWWYTNS